MFPNPRSANLDGIVAIGGALTVKTLFEAYCKGIFPWPQPGYPLLWFSPDPRGVLDFANLRVPRSLTKWAKKNQHLQFTMNQNFSEVIQQCRLQERPDQDGTWILPQMVRSYTEFHKAGYAMSLECWEDGALIGGIYGVLVNGLFSGESMFYKKPNVSKICLLKMIEFLKSKGHTWMDIQMVTPVTASFGGKYISRDEYLKRIGI